MMKYKKRRDESDERDEPIVSEDELDHEVGQKIIFLGSVVDPDPHDTQDFCNPDPDPHGHHIKIWICICVK